MQRERIVQAVRFQRRRRDARNAKLDPISASRIDDKDLAVQVQQDIKVGVLFSHHANMLSD